MNEYLELISPDGAALATANNSFISNWADKRSCPYIGISVVIRGTGTITGTLTLETSNILERKGGTYGGPDAGISGTTVANGLATPNNTTNPDDLLTYGGSVAVSQSVTTTYHFEPTVPMGAHWVRVRYVASLSTAGETVSIYFNGCRTS